MRLGVKNEKNEKSKYVFWKKMKILRKESVLIFKEIWGERGVLSTFLFFSHTPSGGR
jgi:hypothetical protein